MLFLFSELFQRKTGKKHVIMCFRETEGCQRWAWDDLWRDKCCTRPQILRGPRGKSFCNCWLDGFSIPMMKCVISLTLTLSSSSSKFPHKLHKIWNFKSSRFNLEEAIRWNNMFMNMSSLFHPLLSLYTQVFQWYQTFIGCSFLTQSNSCTCYQWSYLLVECSKWIFLGHSNIKEVFLLSVFQLVW